MKYEKPLIVRSADALSAVHSSNPPTKGIIGSDQHSTTQQTIPAYEADE